MLTDIAMLSAVGRGLVMHRIIKNQINLLLVSKDCNCIDTVSSSLSKLSVTIQVVEYLDDLYGCYQPNSFDIVLLDLNFERDQIQTIASDMMAHFKSPLIIICDDEDDDLGVSIILLGAQDFIRKRDIYETRLGLKIHFSIIRFKALKDLDENRRMLRIQSERKTRFLAHFSHEIRNPLNTIQGLVDLLKDENLNANQLELIESLAVVSKNLNHVVNDILDVSKIENGINPTFSQKFKVADLIDDLNGIFHIITKQKKVDFEVILNENVPSSLVSDVKRIFQILNNLVSNSVKYTESGSIKVVIGKSEDDESLILFEVIDTGRGIPESYFSNLFTSYSQVFDEDRKIGTGLGLSICYELSKSLGGTIGARNNEEGGATFWFTIKNQERNQNSAGKINREIHHVARVSPAKMNRESILLVDDDIVNLKVTERIVESLGFKPIACCSGAEALIAASKNNISLAFVDINLEDSDGVTLAGSMNQQANKFPIIALSGAVKEKLRCVEAGMSDFLLKPVTKDDLQKAIFRNLS